MLLIMGRTASRKHQEIRQSNKKIPLASREEEKRACFFYALSETLGDCVILLNRVFNFFDGFISPTLDRTLPVECNAPRQKINRHTVANFA